MRSNIRHSHGAKVNVHRSVHSGIEPFPTDYWQKWLHPGCNFRYCLTKKRINNQQ